MVAEHDNFLRGIGLLDRRGERSRPYHLRARTGWLMPIYRDTDQPWICHGDDQHGIFRCRSRSFRVKDLDAIIAIQQIRGIQPAPKRLLDRYQFVTERSVDSMDGVRMD